MRKPRYIKPETIHIGDTIRVEWQTEDVTRTIVGTVAERDYRGASRVFSTKSGQELLRYIPGVTSINKMKIVLLAEAETRTKPALF